MLKKNKNPQSRNIFKKKSKAVADIINKVRNNYFRTKLNSAKGDNKATYAIVNHLLGNEDINSVYPSGKSDKEVADKLANFFQKKFRK